MIFELYVLLTQTIYLKKLVEIHTYKCEFEQKLINNEAVLGQVIITLFKQLRHA